MIGTWPNESVKRYMRFVGRVLIVFSVEVLAIALYDNGLALTHSSLRDSRTWVDPNGGETAIMFSTPETESSCTLTDHLYTEGVPGNWLLVGYVIVRHPNSGTILAKYTVDNVGELDFLIEYPPEDRWEVDPMVTNQRLIHVDVAINVIDESGNLVSWIGGDQLNAPGVLGPGGQDWGRSCVPLTLVTRINGMDANNPDGIDVPFVAPGESITWTYEIRNYGNIVFLIDQISVSDSITGVNPIFDSVLVGDEDKLFEPGEVWGYRADGTALNLASSLDLPLMKDSCHHGDISNEGSWAYLNYGKVISPSGTSIDRSSYCNGSEISGVVWWDADRDGLRSSEEVIFQNIVSVELLSCDVSMDTVMKQSSTTGDFRFSGLVPSKYSLMFSFDIPVQFSVPHRDHPDDIRDSDVDPMTGSTPCISLGGGMLEDGWDVGVSQYKLFAPYTAK